MKPIDKATQNALLDRLSKYASLFYILAAFVNFLAISIGCVFPERSYSVPKKRLNWTPRTTGLFQKYVQYKAMSKQTEDKDGFIETDETDSMLFSGLLASTGKYFNVTAARDEKGLYHRRPLGKPSMPDARSTFSRDMSVGLLWFFYGAKRADLAEAYMKALKENNFIMGDGDISRIYMTPGLQTTLADIIYALTGKSNIRSRIPQFWPTGLVGYELHLQILHILLIGEIHGAISPKMLDIVKYSHKHNDENPLFACAYALYVSGDTRDTLDLLEDKQYYPEDRLPTEKDRSSHWLPERDYGMDYIPDPRGTKVHSGGDFCFVARLIFNNSGL